MSVQYMDIDVYIPLELGEHAPLCTAILGRERVVLDSM